MTKRTADARLGRQRWSRPASSFFGELALELVEDSVTGKHLPNTRIWLASLANGGDELAVLKLDTVHRDVHLADVDGLFTACRQIIVPCDVRAVAADVAKECS